MTFERDLGRQHFRGYLRRSPDHDCAAHLTRASGDDFYKCTVCGSIHKPRYWREERGGLR